MFAQWGHYAALPLRLVLGVIFLVHGAQHLFGMFGGAGVSGTAEFMTSVGFTPGMFWAVVVGVAELLGGAALLLGVLTRWVALVLGLGTLVALVWASAPRGFAAAQGGIELPLALLGGLVSLILSGSHVYALDAYLPRTAALRPPSEPERKAA